MKLIRQTRIVALILALCMVLCCFSGYSKADAKEIVKEVEDNDYRITITEQSAWDSGSVAEVRIKNTCDKAIRNWGVSLSLTSGKVINCWNTDVTNKDNRYEFRCHNDNREIKPGEEIAFGYQLSGADISNVTDVKLVKYSTENNKSEDYSINHRIVNQWDNKATIETVITN
ncbi:cellulose binding domain-containing protein, partial [Eubacterium xylanophilum]|uniref:cellulose binding domain-containing protein n=1 Tax=Eubacterium xylanophilum TaxID=39497 RepID=UPI000555B3D8